MSYFVVDIKYTTFLGKKILYTLPGWTEIFDQMSFEDCYNLLNSTYDYAALSYINVETKCHLFRGYIDDNPLSMAVDDGSVNDTVIIKRGNDEGRQHK